MSFVFFLCQFIQISKTQEEALMHMFTKSCVCIVNFNLNFNLIKYLPC